MPVWKFLLLVTGATLALGVVFFLGMGAFFWFIKGPSGTLDEAVTKVSAQRGVLAQIVRISESDPALVSVGPEANPKSWYDLNGPRTSFTMAHYNGIALILMRGGFQSLQIDRDLKNPNKIRAITFMVFDYGWFGNTAPVLAEWTPDGKLPPWHQSNDACKLIGDGWHVCEDDI